MAIDGCVKSTLNAASSTFESNGDTMAFVKSTLNALNSTSENNSDV